MFPSLVQRLIQSLDAIVVLMEELLDASTIDYVEDRAARFVEETHFFIPGLPDGMWGESNDIQRRLQRGLMERWRPWVEQTRLLFSEDTQDRQQQINDATGTVGAWIERTGHVHAIPPTILEAKHVFRTMTQPLFEALEALAEGSERVVAVPDTNVLIRNPDITTYGKVLGTESYTVLLVPGVLGELDGHKVNHKNPNVREKARQMSDRIKGWRNQGSLATGVKVQANIWVQVEGREPDLSKTLSWLQSNIVDDRILASLLQVQRHRPADRVVLLSGDTLMLSKADAASVPTADTPDPDP